MNVKASRWRLSSIRPSLRMVAFLGLLMLALPSLASWVAQRIHRPVLFNQPDFEEAYQAVLELGEKASGYASALGGFNNYGISQLDYDTWRQLNGKPIKDLTDISETEVKAIYQTYWQKGDCAQYETPLDVACLDSMISFGIQQGKTLFVNLPKEPQQAAMEVASRREVMRRKRIRPPITPGKQLAIREGLKRDRALADWVASVDLPQPQAKHSLPFSLPFNHSTPQTADSDSLTAEQIYQKLKPVTAEIWNHSQIGTATTAAGIILTPDGLILTNYHVVESMTNPRVKLADGRKYDGTVTSIDPGLDLALIQLKGARGLSTVPFSQDTSQIKVGDTVYAIGSPRGESWKMSTSRIIELNSTCANGSSPLRCIRTPGGFLFPGNSGGPLIDTTGQVIGINRAIQQSTGEGVSIPIETIQTFLNQRMGQPSHTLPDQVQPDQIQPDQVQPDQIQPDQIQPDQIPFDQPTNQDSRQRWL